MALGGGSFITQNKVLPGAYINFISRTRATSALSDRGVVTIALELNWGAERVIEVTSDTLQKEALKTFGYPYDSKELSPLRDIFCNATKLYLYRLNAGGNKAANDFATAKCAGTRGNDIKIMIQANVDEPSKYDVSTILGTSVVDTQTVAAASELKDNDFVSFKSDAVLSVTAATALTGGTNKTVTGTEHSAYLAEIEPYAFNAIGCMASDAVTAKLYAAFTKRMREEVGAKFQCVVYNYAADYEGVINVKNAKEIIPWVLGAEGGCAVNKSCTNKKYDGEAEVQTAYTQTQLENAIKAGEFVLHKVGDDVCVLTDINSLVTLTEEKGEVFQSNQSIRVMNQIANDIAAIFKSKYIGKIANDMLGRNALWLDIVQHHEKLQDIGAIEGFSGENVTVEPGEAKKSVVVSDVVTVVNAMEQLYMTVVVQ